jgi:hypothetical protein
VEPILTWRRARTAGDGGADADEDEEEGEDELAEHGADAAGVRRLAAVAERKLRHLELIDLREDGG